MCRKLYALKHTKLSVSISKSIWNPEKHVDEYISIWWNEACVPQSIDTWQHYKLSSRHLRPAWLGFKLLVLYHHRWALSHLSWVHLFLIKSLMLRNETKCTSTDIPFYIVCGQLHDTILLTVSILCSLLGCLLSKFASLPSWFSCLSARSWISSILYSPALHRTVQ